ncbi:Cof-type HAD-IIB family hydrolase [Lacticaseibacillus camelliae]|nr:Cof-type HAD-IIB family hydrolase [Lacticaseibacillus camelliae]
MIKLIASDLDGTLLNADSEVSPANAQAIRDAQAAGIEFIVATGRNLPQAQPRLSRHGLKPAFITINGALVYNEAGQVKVHVPLAHDLLLAVLDQIDRAGFYCELVVPDGVVSNSYEHRLADMKHALRHYHADWSEDQLTEQAKHRIQYLSTQYVDDYRQFITPKAEILKVVVFADGGQAALAPLKAQLEAQGSLAVTSSGENNLEINAQDAQKGPALAAYAALKQITMAEVMAIGDNLNDESMIRMAKYSVAMANAVPKIKQLAWHVTGTNVEDGVAQAIHRAIALNEQEKGGEVNAVLH